MRAYGAGVPPQLSWSTRRGGSASDRRTDDEGAVRRAKILTAARWCFLNFGFAKTRFEDIASANGNLRDRHNNWCSSGIGAATPREVARRGFHVLAGVGCDRDADAIRGPGIEPLITDITHPAHIRALADRVRGDSQRRAVRALVNNAGIGVNVPFEAFPINEWRRLFEVNLFGHVAVTQALLPALIRSKGHMINISSVGGKDRPCHG